MDLETLNRAKVIEYAEKYWNTVNWNYPYYEFTDCTNFVSQCWNYGGIGMTGGWHSYGASTKLTSRSWAEVEAFFDYMTKTSALYTEDGQPLAEVKWSSDGIQIGDVIQFYKPDEGWHHAAIVSGFDPIYGITYAAHSDPHLHKPLSDKYPHEETLIRFICPRKSM